MNNLVKFQRGTPKAYEQLKYKDKDTLYVIFEKGAETGSLYLGEKLIAGLGAESLTTEFDGLKDGDILIYDEEKQAWVNQQQKECIIDAVDTDVFTITNKQLKLKKVPVSAIPDLSGQYVTNNTFNTTVGSLQQADQNIINQLNEFNLYLTWIDI